MIADQVLVDIVRKKNVHTKCTVCGGTNHSAEKCYKNIKQEKEKARASCASDNIQTDKHHENILNVDQKIP